MDANDIDLSVSLLHPGYAYNNETNQRGGKNTNRQKVGVAPFVKLISKTKLAPIFIKLEQ